MTFQNPYCLNYMGSKSTCIYCSDGTAPTIVRGHGHDMHVIVFPEKKNRLLSGINQPCGRQRRLSTDAGTTGRTERADAGF